METAANRAELREAEEETSTRGRKAAGQDPAKRMQILAGANRVFSRMGFDAASMNDITREAGVSKGTIYVYFQDKDELFEALVDHERKAMFSDFYDVLSTGDIADTLYRHGVALVRKVTNPLVVRAQRVVIGISERKPELGARFYESGPRLGHNRLAAFLDRAVAAGRMSIPDTSLAAEQFSGLCLAGTSRPLLFSYRTTYPDEAEIAATVRSAVQMFMKSYAVEAV